MRGSSGALPRTTSLLFLKNACGMRGVASGLGILRLGGGDQGQCDAFILTEVQATVRIEGPRARTGGAQCPHPVLHHAHREAGTLRTQAWVKQRQISSQQARARGNRHQFECQQFRIALVPGHPVQTTAGSVFHKRLIALVGQRMEESDQRIDLPVLQGSTEFQLLERNVLSHFG